jgi:DNA recombination protein RmuC
MPIDSILTQYLPILVAVAAGAAVIAALCALILAFRRGPAAALDAMRDRLIELELNVKHMDNTMRDEIARVRTEAQDRGDKLRDGLTTQVTALGDSIGGRVEESRRTVDQRMTGFAKEAAENADRLKFAVQQSIAGFGEGLTTRISDFQALTTATLSGVETRVVGLTAETETRQNHLRQTVEERLELLRAGNDAKLEQMRADAVSSAQAVQGELKTALAGFGEALNARIAAFTEAQSKGQADFLTLTTTALANVEKRVAALTAENEARQNELRKTVEDRLEQLRLGNDAKLEQMRQTVDEKLQGTLEKRLGESFALVSERLENVQRGLGEMQTLALGVGDLKKVLANVKDRGGWAEIQLGMLLEDMLNRDQFHTNVAVDPSSSERVEYVVRLPGQDAESEVWLPIDAKFPKEDYERLIDAMQTGDATAIRAAQLDLSRVIEAEAKKISSKYIREPRTTNFAIMYLPTEGLFAEALRFPGLAAKLQTAYRVTVAGPTTLAALLNSLQMGFHTLHIQKRSSEVWKVLGEAKSEFEKYGVVWERLKKQLETAQNTVEEAGKRTRAVTRKLRDIAVVETVSGPATVLELTIDEEPET